MTVDAHSVFRHYSHRAEGKCDVTFNLRDLRAMVTLCEHMQAEVTIRYFRLWGRDNRFKLAVKA
jgi:hypothetical protein